MGYYAIFLDDERDPPMLPMQEWIICRSYDDFVSIVRMNGFPGYISFDHDLGQGKTGHDVAKWLLDRVLNDPDDFPENFRYYVHSQNSIGKKNIEGTIEDILRYVRSRVNPTSIP